MGACSPSSGGVGSPAPTWGSVMRAKQPHGLCWPFGTPGWAFCQRKCEDLGRVWADGSENAGGSRDKAQQVAPVLTSKKRKKTRAPQLPYGERIEQTPMQTTRIANQ